MNATSSSDKKQTESKTVVNGTVDYKTKKGTSIDDKSKTKSAKTNDLIFQKVGYIMEEFKCCHNNFQGILYVGPLAIVFLGRMLLFEWTVVIKWDEVRKVVKCVEKGYENGIRIDAQQPGTTESTKYYFERFFDSNKALGMLISLHNDSILELTSKMKPSARSLSRGLRRTNSDPLRISNLFNFDDDALVFQSDDDIIHDYNNNPKNTSQSNIPIEETKSSSEFPPPKEVASSVPGRGTTSDRAYRRSSTYNFSPASAQVVLIPEGNKTVSSSDENTGDKSKNLQEEWQAVLQDKSYSEIVIQDLELPCDLDTFLSDFVLDQAKHSMATFMAGCGDQDIQISPWKKSDEDGSITQGRYSRIIEYTHPIDAPMAPPLARARKEQSYVRYGDYGLIFDTQTYVSDVPMTDCFYVADRIRVERKENADQSTTTTSPTILISVAFDVRFVKSTMFRAIITRTTKSELQKFCHSLAEFLSRAAGTKAVSEDTSQFTTKPSLASRPAPPSKSIESNNNWTQVCSLFLLLAMLGMQGWMMREFRDLKMELLRQSLSLESCSSGPRPQPNQPQLRIIHGDDL
ncbi:protein of unknown function DUF4782 containing protein [Nitzschia inconspicua]|uniref:VASt domain-containing protein n=1 Tax=Nitzschia inconspicua TaxID=303405 RepID=A0A9K3KDA7_9STRA|nr:protein of unknown function DUF4782 containing protein [Nitzschia inconspicua]